MSLFAEWTPTWPAVAVVALACGTLVTIVWITEGCPWPRRRDR